MRSRHALDGLNFLLADVRDGAGPFLAIYLLSTVHWDAGRIGVVMTAAGLATVVARAPIGALIDRTRWKRGLVVAAAATVAVFSCLIPFYPSLPLVIAAQIVIGAADAVFAPAVAAITRGIFDPAHFTRRIGRNEAFNHAGNAFTAVAAGLAGTFVAPVAVIWLVAILAAASILATLRIRADAIDHERARGAEDGQAADRQTEGDDGFIAGLRLLARSRALCLFTAAITLFHFANAAMLPLLGERLAIVNTGDGPLFMAACIITAQLVMVPMAILVGHKADRWGRKPIFLAGFAVLPLRGILYTLWGDPYYLVAVQMLDGVGAGIFGALFFIVIGDLTRGTGHYNLAQGAASACWGLGAALSNSVAGAIVDAAGYDAAFTALATVALGAFLLYLVGVPETCPSGAVAERRHVVPALAPGDGAGE